MRSLDFDWFPGGVLNPKARETYEILYDGLLYSPKSLVAPSETRIVGRILDKFEGIGEITERPQGVKTYTLKTTLAQWAYRVHLEEEEYKLMDECLKAVKWATKAARQVTMALEFFAQLPEPKPPEELPVDAPK